MTERLGSHEIERATSAIRSGQLVAFPTETVYGLGADASQPGAVGRVFEAKGRPKGHPLIVHLGQHDDVACYVTRMTESASKLAHSFWPGPLTLVLPKSDAVCPEAVGGKSTVGLRVPDHPVALALLDSFGGGIAAPSANRFGGVSPTTAQHVLDDLDGHVDVVLDGGVSAIGVESTIVDLTEEQPTLLRPGGISVVEIEAVLGMAVVDGRSHSARASGMLASHYSPAATVELVSAEELQERLTEGTITHGTGVVAPFSLDDWLAGEGVVGWSLGLDASEYGAALYATLRAADSAGLNRLIVAPPASGPLLDAVVDRLKKAAHPG